MRIVDVCGFYSPAGGGVKTYIEQKLRIGASLGHDITILAPGSGNGTIEISPGARIATVASPRFPLDRNYHYFTDKAAVHAAIDACAPDLVEASSPWRSATFVADYPADLPRALVMHSEPLSAYAYRWFERVAPPHAVDRQFEWFWERLRLFGRRFDLVVAANTDLARRLRAGRVGNVATIPMGVEPGRFSPALRDEGLRAHLLKQCALGPGATLLVAAGRLATEKRIPMLVEAVARAGRSHPIGLAIFGAGRTQAKVLRAIAGNPHIRLFGPEHDRARFARLLASADGLLHGCEAETFGMIAAEANASGIPVIAPDAGGAADFAGLVKGLTYRATDAGDAVRAILQLANRSPVRVAPTGRTMHDHLIDLLARYQNLGGQRRFQAA